jgi:molybdenum cofactor cytidylyltransferase
VPKKIGIIVLAAGGSTRFGTPKQLYKYEGKSLIRRAASTALSCDAEPVIISLGSDHEAIEKEVAGLQVTIVFNPTWRSGMASSLTVALRHLTTFQNDIDAVMFMLCDQPQVTSEMLTNLIQTYESKGGPIVAAEYSSTLGVPALFDRSMFGELFDLTGDQGAKSVIKDHINEVHRVPMPDAAFDIDSLEDVEQK